MTPEAQKWRDHFARCEEEQGFLFPPRRPQTPLEQAQAGVALSFLRHTFPPEKWTAYSNSLVAFHADEPTRFAFFEHFGFNSSRPIFCFPSREWKPITEKFKQAATSMSVFSRRWHEFSSGAQVRPASSEALPDEFDPQTLFLRSYGSSYGPLAAEGHEELWHWNGESLVQLPGYGSLWHS